MARSRNIKPSFFKNELLGQADPLLSLLFASLWTLADRQGRLEDRPLRIKAETFPYREITDFNGYLTQLEQHGFIERYKVGELAIIQVVNFRKHQAPHNTEKASELPDKPIDSPVTVKQPLSTVALTQAKRPDSLNLITDSPNTDSLIPGVKPLSEYSDEFEQFWKAYPSKTGKGGAYKSWKKERPSLQAVLKALEWQVKSDQWTKDKGQYIPMPSTYLNQRRFEDAPKCQQQDGKFDANEFVRGLQ